VQHNRHFLTCVKEKKQLLTVVKFTLAANFAMRIGILVVLGTKKGMVLENTELYLWKHHDEVSKQHGYKKIRKPSAL